MVRRKEGTRPGSARADVPEESPPSLAYLDVPTGSAPIRWRRVGSGVDGDEVAIGEKARRRSRDTRARLQSGPRCRAFRLVGKGRCSRWRPSRRAVRFAGRARKQRQVHRLRRPIGPGNHRETQDHVGQHGDDPEDQWKSSGVGFRFRDRRKQGRRPSAQTGAFHYRSRPLPRVARQQGSSERRLFRQHKDSRRLAVGDSERVLDRFIVYRQNVVCSDALYAVESPSSHAHGCALPAQN